MPCRVVHRHTFHESCVAVWIAQNPSCPLCRTAIARTEGDGLGPIPPDHIPTFEEQIAEWNVPGYFERLMEEYGTAAVCCAFSYQPLRPIKEVSTQVTRTFLLDIRNQMLLIE